MTQQEILAALRQNALPDGTSEFKFSNNAFDKQAEKDMLKRLENEGRIQQLTIALGYAVYRLL